MASYDSPIFSPIRLSKGLRTIDPRIYQLLALSTLLTFGIAGLDFSISARIVVATLATAIVSQYLFASGRFDPRSALISALSLCLLLRTNDLGLAMAAAFIAIASKRFIQLDGKHLFNPTALALVVVTTLSSGAWISPGQWGHTALLMILIAAAGSFVTNRASRLDISVSFLVAYSTIVIGRAFYLGDPIALPLHQLSSGALLIFAFFMISDPRTTPDSRTGRVLFACLVALGAALIEFGLYRPNGAIVALVLAAPAVPVINRFLIGQVFHWPHYSQSKARSDYLGVHHG